MSEASRIESLLDQAREKEKQYDWLRAIEPYSNAVQLVPKEDFSTAGQLHECLGYSLYRAAFQAESEKDFRAKCAEAVESYKKSKELLARSSEAKKAGMFRCDAMAALIGYWLTSEVQDKKKNLDECWKQTKMSLDAFKQNGDFLEYGKTFDQLSFSIDLRVTFGADYEALRNILKEGIAYGEDAIKFLSDEKVAYELARAYARSSTYVNSYAIFFGDEEDRKEDLEKAKEYAGKAEALSKEAFLLESLTILERPGLDGGEGTDQALRKFENALEYSKKTRDKFLIGSASDHLAYHMAWKGRSSEDPDERVECVNKALEYAKGAKDQFSRISFISPGHGFFWSEEPDAEYFLLLSYFETDIDKKRELLEKAALSESRLMKRAAASGYPRTINHVHHTISKLFVTLAHAESNAEQKKRLLEKALQHREETLENRGLPMLRHNWDRGIMLCRFSDLKSDLADFATTDETKKNLLQEAVDHKKKSIELLRSALTIFKAHPPAPLVSELTSVQHSYAAMLAHLYKLTNNKEHLRRAAEAFEDTLKLYLKLDTKSWIAECHWHAAQVYDDLGEYLKAAENFDDAQKNFEMAAEKIPQLRNMLQEHTLYMHAWSEIEKARYHHARQEHGPAKEHFEKAAKLQETSKHWSYMAPNYLAWVQVEDAEDLSRKEQSEEAIQAFDRAEALFVETRKSLQKQVDKIEDFEKEMATEVLKATDLRQKYCKARIVLEEAKIFDKKGDHFSSSEKYDSAAQIFEKTAQMSMSEQEQRELRLISVVARAWQKMTRAEAEASPELYIEASRLFEDAKEFTVNEKTRMLILGHSRFCRALESGTRFADTRDMKMYQNSMNALESAGNYYAKAGFQKASEYAKATKLLFEAYVRMDNAKEENDPDRKARLYAMAEKILQTSAGSFMKAEHPEKREQVLVLLETVKEERELALSLNEVLHAPSIMSTTASFTAPTPTSEEAVGSEKFENASIQANVIVSRKELKVGETLDVEIELVNAGKGPAVLIKIVEGIPEGFELTQKPDSYRVENSHLNLKGKRLDPLKTEEVKLVLKPKVQGVFPLRPRIMYLDENGRYKSYEAEPISITVRELGIKGWLKGER